MHREGREGKRRKKVVVVLMFLNPFQRLQERVAPKLRPFFFSYTFFFPSFSSSIPGEKRVATISQAVGGGGEGEDEEDVVLDPPEMVTSSGGGGEWRFLLEEDSSEPVPVKRTFVLRETARNMAILERRYGKRELLGPGGVGGRRGMRKY